jgi:chromosome segregation protein
MKIKKLEIAGFKSFSDKTSINFPTGISAIVGPNGCGKSNVIDALRWVMGEQSVKQLRGKSMEDIIFAGTNGRQPLNMAEVTITLMNDNGHAPEEFKDFSEISVTRRLFRSGESAYLINKQPCRLKDIYNLFLGSGVGARTFAIIQQGNIGAIIDAGPEERRLFIEEAAGVTRYKFRKNEALRKVKATEQNLLRINDIVSEVNRQMAGLHRQAKKAERYKSYQERIKTIDSQLLLNYFDDYNQQIATTETLLRELKDADIGHVTQLKKIDAAVEAIKLKRWQKSQEISAKKSSQFETQRKIDRSEADRKHLKNEIERLAQEIHQLEQAQVELTGKTTTIGSEVVQVESQNSRLQQEIAQFKGQVEQQRSAAQTLQHELNQLNQKLEERKNKLMALVAEEARYKNIFQNASNNRENLKRRLKRIDEEVFLSGKKVAAAEKDQQAAQSELEQINQSISEYQTRIGHLQATLSDQAAELGRQVKHTQTLDVQREKVRSQLATLKKMAANFEWYRDGVKAVMRARQTAEQDSTNSAQGLKGIIGLLAEVLDPAPGYETAVEAVLGEALQYILVHDHGSGAAAIEFLQARGAGRSGFIPVSSMKSFPGTDQGGIADEVRLLNHVSIQPEYQPIAAALLGHVAVVPTLNEAVELFQRNGRVQTIVTVTGDVVSHQGVLIGGSQEQLAGILAKKHELKNLESQAETLDHELTTAKQHQKELEESVRKLETELQQLIAYKNNAAEDAVAAEKALYRLGEDLKNARRHHEIVQLEQEQLMGEESDLDEELEKYNQALSGIAAEVQSTQSQTAQMSEEIGKAAARLENQNQQVVDIKLELTALNAKLENGTQTLNRLREFERDSHLRLDQLKQEIALKSEKRTTSQAKLSSDELLLQKAYSELQQLSADLADNESEFNSIDSALQERDQQVADIQSAREKTLEKTRLVELDLSEKRIRRDNIVSKVQERYHCSMTALRMQQQQKGESLEMSVAEMEKELQNVRSKAENIGEVNLGAIKEYEELKQRFDFLSEQRDDLVTAIEDLHRVIRKINRITQQLFMETYAKVNEKLQEVFPKLFDGGSARLELTEPNKPLETGVEYLVHPPGKKLTRMSLLSGGEKALSAIAFIFAIFLIRPASFCLLDEIDAPLDEANVIRFNNLMKAIGENSQIIMITHNKRSMEFAEMLFGVTMEQKGVSKVVSVNLKGKES